MKIPGMTLPASAAALALMISGCTGTAPTSEGDDGGTEQIRYLIEQPEDAETIELIEGDLATFEEQNPDIDVELEVMPLDSMRTVLQTQLRSGEGPDVFGWGSGPGYAGALAEAGLLYDLTAAYEEYDWPVYDFAKERVTSDGKLIGIPGDIETIGIFYNQNIFDELGIDQPENLSDLEAAAGRIDEAGITPFAISDKEGWQGGHLLSMALSSRIGPDGMDSLLAGETPWTSPDVVAALNTWDQFSSAGYLTEFPTALSYDDGNSLFYSGEAAILPTGSWLAPEIQNGVDFEVGYVPFPAEDGQGIFSGGLGSGPLVSANTANPEAAIKFLDYLMTPEHGRWTIENQSTIPPFPVDTEGVDTSPLFAQVVTDAAQIADGTGEFGYNIDVLTTDVFNDAMINGIQALLTDQKTAEEVAQDLETAFQAG
ncbi:extracellular solute-binding protein [Arthrobacter sp. Br18]|uniref:ABC transporter substrate-binding protein n=1 Tax=Arthrobacter sp. Br18 TaxID=1312954 RepID=UPI000478AA21|nr:extracellular solute-binding protein [Arthrobacter sp. Br18]